MENLIHKQFQVQGSNDNSPFQWSDLLSTTILKLIPSWPSCTPKHHQSHRCSESDPWRILLISATFCRDGPQMNRFLHLERTLFWATLLYRWAHNHVFSWWNRAQMIMKPLVLDWELLNFWAIKWSYTNAPMACLISAGSSISKSYNGPKSSSGRSWCLQHTRGKCTNFYEFLHIKTHKESLIYCLKKKRFGSHFSLLLESKGLQQFKAGSYLSSCFTRPIAQTATEMSLSSASSIIRLENLSVNRPRVGTLSSTSYRFCNARTEAFRTPALFIHSRR